MAIELKTAPTAAAPAAANARVPAKVWGNLGKTYVIGGVAEFVTVFGIPLDQVPDAEIRGNNLRMRKIAALRNELRDEVLAAVVGNLQPGEANLMNGLEFQVRRVAEHSQEELDAVPVESVTRLSFAKKA